MNIGQHCHILSIGDCSKDEARQYFLEDLLPHVPERLQDRLRFDELYRAFGGKLAHLADYSAPTPGVMLLSSPLTAFLIVSEFINSDGEISREPIRLPSSHGTRLNNPLRSPAIESSHFLQAHTLINLQLIHSTPSKTTGDVESPGFEIYSALKSVSPHAAPTPFAGPSFHPGADFTNLDLLKVMNRLVPEPPLDPVWELAYFPLCRELGARAVDGLVRARILELRWCATITEEGNTKAGVPRRKSEAIGPVLVPATPVLRFAMAQVLTEYE